ncbi:hypothetical protein [Pseudomonas phage vB_PaeP_TUMS_P10]|nr:hypothetical protein [Pseudomonas phage vB_PaeS_TUMS_P6]UNI72017.1 hypothetical protein [Pseudomonas phage vB_PaeP_TUMS_P10]
MNEELGKAILYLHLDELSSKYFKEKILDKWGYVIGAMGELGRTVNGSFMEAAEEIAYARQ